MSACERATAVFWEMPRAELQPLHWPVGMASQQETQKTWSLLGQPPPWLAKAILVLFCSSPTRAAGLGRHLCTSAAAQPHQSFKFALPKQETAGAAEVSSELQLSMTRGCDLRRKSGRLTEGT